ncbi:MAG: hypothetical protein PHH27_00845, partial [Candidatus Colwellbacteria bacterium]|nr:hypothetical protein [Candidatus Colwellbacteria bacterium]
MSRKEKQSKKRIKKENHANTIWMVAGLSLLVIIGAAYVFFSQPSGGVSVDVETEAPVRIGEAFDVSVTLENNSEEEISEAVISLILPQGVVFADGRSDVRRSVDIKSVPGGAFERESFKVVITDYSEQKTFNIETEYQPASLNKPLKITRDFSVDVERWLEIGIEAPENIVSGEEFEWVFSYKNNSNDDWDVNFEFNIPEELETDLPEENLTISAGEEESQVLTGSIILEEGKSFFIRAIAKGKMEGKEYILDEAYIEPVMASSPLSLNIVTAGDLDEPVSPGQEITYSISFRNNTDIPLSNISVRASLIGEMFDMESISSRGDINFPAKTITWNIGNVPELQKLDPGESRSLGLSIKAKDSYPIMRLNDRNF